MKTVWKYQLPLMDEIRLVMPQGAMLLSVQVQNGVPFVWALLDTDAPRVERRLTIVGTGHDAAHIWSTHVYVGTFQLADGALVLHLFDDGPTT